MWDSRWWRALKAAANDPTQRPHRRVISTSFLGGVARCHPSKYHELLALKATDIEKGDVVLCDNEIAYSDTGVRMFFEFDYEHESKLPPDTTVLDHVRLAVGVVRNAFDASVDIGEAMVLVAHPKAKRKGGKDIFHRGVHVVFPDVVVSSDVAKVLASKAAMAIGAVCHEWLGVVDTAPYKADQASLRPAYAVKYVACPNRGKSPATAGVTVHDPKDDSSALDVVKHIMGAPRPKKKRRLTADVVTVARIRPGESIVLPTTAAIAASGSAELSAALDDDDDDDDERRTAVQPFYASAADVFDTPAAAGWIAQTIGKPLAAAAEAAFGTKSRDKCQCGVCVNGRVAVPSHYEPRWSMTADGKHHDATSSGDVVTTLRRTSIIPPVASPYTSGCVVSGTITDNVMSRTVLGRSRIVYKSERTLIRTMDRSTKTRAAPRATIASLRAAVLQLVVKYFPSYADGIITSSVTIDERRGHRLYLNVEGEKSRLCAINGGHHYSNRVFFSFDLVWAKVTVRCHDPKCRSIWSLYKRSITKTGVRPTKKESTDATKAKRQVPVTPQDARRRLVDLRVDMAVLESLTKHVTETEVSKLIEYSGVRADAVAKSKRNGTKIKKRRYDAIVHKTRTEKKKKGEEKEKKEKEEEEEQKKKVVPVANAAKSDPKPETSWLDWDAEAGVDSDVNDRVDVLGHSVMDHPNYPFKDHKEHLKALRFALTRKVNALHKYDQLAKYKLLRRGREQFAGRDERLEKWLKKGVKKPTLPRLPTFNQLTGLIEKNKKKKKKKEKEIAE